MAVDLSVKTRTKQPEIRRDQLLDAAEKLFATKGLVETTVADISEEAGVAKGTFYLYFPSKGHCVVAVKKRLADGIVDRFIAVLAPEFDRLARGDANIDVTGVTARILDVSFSYAAEHADIHQALFHVGDTHEVDQVSLEAEAAIVSCLTQAFRMMNEVGVAAVTHPEHTARILFSGVHWALEDLLRRDRPERLHELKETALEIVTRVLAPPS